MKESEIINKLHDFFKSDSTCVTRVEIMQFFEENNITCVDKTTWKEVNKAIGNLRHQKYVLLGKINEIKKILEGV